MDTIVLVYDDVTILDIFYNEINDNDKYKQFMTILDTIIQDGGTPDGYYTKNLSSKKGYAVCEIRLNKDSNELIRFFYYYERNKLILIIDYMFKPKIYENKKDTKDVEKKYDDKILFCQNKIDDFKKGILKENTDYIYL